MSSEIFDKRYVLYHNERFMDDFVFGAQKYFKNNTYVFLTVINDLMVEKILLLVKYYYSITI